MTYAVMTSSARMPNSCKGIYRNVALVEHKGDRPPKMISERARGMIRIVWHSGPCSVGRTERCAYAQALAYASRQLAELEKRE